MTRAPDGLAMDQVLSADMYGVAYKGKGLLSMETIVLKKCQLQPEDEGVPPLPFVRCSTRPSLGTSSFMHSLLQTREGCQSQGSLVAWSCRIFLLVRLAMML